MTLVEILCAVVLLSLLAIGLGDMVRQSGEYEARLSQRIDTLRDLRRAKIELQSAARMEPGSYAPSTPPSYAIGQSNAAINTSGTLSIQLLDDSYFAVSGADGTLYIKRTPIRDITADCEYDLILRDCR